MAKFVTIGYGDRDGYDRTDQSVRDAAHAHPATAAAEPRWGSPAHLCRCATMMAPASKPRAAPSCAPRCQWRALL